MHPRSCSLFLLAVLAFGCDVPPQRSTVDTNTGGGSRSPKDLTIPLRHALQPGDAFWVFESAQLENETIAGKLFSRDLRLTLSAQSNGEQSITIRDSNGWVTIAGRGMSWGRYMNGQPTGVFQEFPENSYTYHDNNNNYTYLHLGSGEDTLGRSDTILSLSGGGNSIRMPLRDLYLQRVQDIVARSQRDQWVNGNTARGYRCIEDSEGYPYVINLRWGGSMVVEVWDPFLFQPDFLAKVQRREVDPLALKPLAAFDVDWSKTSGSSTAVDFRSLRRRVYGVDGAPDSIYFVARAERQWFLEGGAETPHRLAVASLKKGHEHYNANRKAQAIPEYTKALEQDPNLADACMYRALSTTDYFWASSISQLPEKVVRRLITDLSRAMELAPGRYRNPDTLQKRAICRTAAKDYAGAEEDYNEVIRLQPANTAAYRERRAIRQQTGNGDGAAADDVQIARLEAEEKRKSEESHREAVQKAENDRREAPDRILVEAGLMKWSYDTSTYGQFVPPYTEKIELLKRRLKDVNEKPLILQLAGSTAEGGAYKFEQLGFKLLKGKKVDSEEKIHVIIEADSDSTGVVKNGQGRVIENLGYGKSVMDRAYNTLLVHYLKGKLDWGSEKYGEIASYWDKVEQKLREKDEGAAVEALDEIIRLDTEDKTAPNRKMQLLEQAKNWAGIAAECSRLLQLKPDDQEIRQRRLKAYEETKDLKGQIEDLNWLGDNTKEDYNRKDYLSRKATALGRAGRWKEALDVLAGLIEKAPNDASLHDRRAEAFDYLGEPERVDQARAKSLEIQRRFSPLAPLVQEGVATWMEKSISIAVRPEFRARHALSLLRLRDPAPIVVYYIGKPELAGELERVGLRIETEAPATYDLTLEATSDGAGRVSLPGGQILGSFGVAGASYYYMKDMSISAVVAFATRGRLPILGKAYEDLLPDYEDLVLALDAGDEAKELSLRKRLAEAFPTHYDLQMEYLLALQRAEEWAQVVEAGTRIASMDSALLERYRKLTTSNYSIPNDPVEGGLKAVIAARMKLGNISEALAAAEGWAARGTDKQAALRSKIEILKAMRDYKAAGGVHAALAAMKLKEIGSEYSLSQAVSEFFAQSDLCRLAGDEAGARDAYRKGVMVSLKDYSYLSSRATERAKRGDFPGAMADANDAIERQGDKVQSYSYAGRAQIRILRGDTDGALQDYAAALRISKDAGYHKERAALFRKQGKEAEAAAEMKLAWSIPPGWASYYADRAKERLAAGDRAGAMDDFSKSIEGAGNATEKAQRFADRAQARRGLKETAGALEDLAKAIETTRDRSEISRFYTIRAEIQGSTGNAAGAVEEYGKAIDASPAAKTRADLLEKRSALKLSLKDSKGAIEDLSRAAGEDETWARVLRRAALHRRLGDSGRAADDVKFARTLPFKPSEAWSLAYALYEAGAGRDGLEVLEKSLPQLTRAKRAGLLSSRAYFRRMLGDLAGAEKDFDAAVQEAPRYDLLVARATFRRDRGNKEGARADLTAACALPLDTTYYYYLTSRATTRYDLGDPEGGFKDAEEAVRLFPREAEPKRILADLLARAGRFDEAQEMAEKALDLSRTNSSVVGTLAQLLAVRGRKEEARKLYDSTPLSDYEWGWWSKADLLLLCGDADEAAKILLQGLERHLAGTYLRMRLAELRWDQGNADETLRLAEEILALNALDVNGLKLRALALTRKSHPDAEKALTELSRNPSMESSRIEVLAEKDPAQALREAEQYAAKYPTLFWTKYLLAKVYAASGDRKAASEALKAATETMGWNDGVSHWRLRQLSKRLQQ